MNDDEKHMQPPDGEPVSPLEPVVAAAAPFEAKEEAPVVEAKADAKLPYEEWARRGGVEHWRADVARHCRAWPLGQEVTESEFNQALHDAFNSRIG